MNMTTNELCFVFAGLSVFFALCAIWLWWESRPDPYADAPLDIDITERAARPRVLDSHEKH